MQQAPTSIILAKHHDTAKQASPAVQMRLSAEPARKLDQQNVTWPAINNKFSLAMPLSVRRLPLVDI